MRGRDVSLLRIEREARGLEDPEDEHADRGRDEERSTSDAVAQKPRDDRDDEVVDVEDAVDEQLGRRVGDCMQSSVSTKSTSWKSLREGD